MLLRPALYALFLTALASVLLALLVLPHTSFASNASASDGIWQSERALFIKIERDLRRGSRWALTHHRARMENYPLYPYLLYQDLRRRIAKVSDEQVIAFLRDYRDIPIADHLRYRWLQNRAHRGHWHTVRNYYVPGLYAADKEVECLYAEALSRSEDSKDLELFEEVILSLWMVKSSQHDTCDRPFSTAKKLGIIDDQAVWDRIVLALQAHNTRLAKYLARSLSPDLKKEYRTLTQAHYKPMTFLQSIDSQGLASAYYRDALLYGLQRAQKKNPYKVLALWRESLALRLKDYPHFTRRLQHRLGLRAAKNLEVEVAEYYLADLPQSTHTAESHFWLIRSYLRLRNWHAVINAIDALDSDARSYPQWQYWKARALEATARQKQAHEIWQALSQHNSYYGYLAADRLNRPYPIIGTKPQDTDYQMLKRIAQRQDVMRIRELLLLHRVFPARSEMWALTERLNSAERKHLAQLTQAWDWADGTIQAMATSQLRYELDLRFPLAFEKIVAKNAHTAQLPQQWLYAVIRRESAFMPKIRSWAGALGLMQLMPRTAAEVAQWLRLAKPTKGQLLRPQLNILLGTTYLKYLHQRFDNSLPLALAAYNGGPSNVNVWNARNPVQDADIWVDTIPFDETRLYVRAVLFYAIVYQYKLESKTTRLSQLLKI